MELSVKIKLFKGTIGGTTKLEEAVDEFSEKVKVCSISTAMYGASVLVTVEYMKKETVSRAKRKSTSS